MDLDRVAFDLRIERIEAVFELGLGQHRAGPLGQGFEQSPLAGGQIHQVAGAPYRARGKVDVQVAPIEKRVGIARIAPGHRGDPGGEFGEVERFDQIVVGTAVEPRDAVGYLIEGRQDDHGRRVAGAPEMFQKVQATSVGQRQVEQNQTIVDAARAALRVGQGLDPVHGMAIGGDLLAHGRAKVDFVLDQKNSHIPAVNDPGKPIRLPYRPDAGLTAKFRARQVAVRSVHHVCAIATEHGNPKMKRTCLTTAVVLGILGAGPALASEHCDAPMSEWQPPEALQQKLSEDGWDVKRIKTEDGCYEAYAIDEQGRQVEAYFDPKTFDVVELKIED